MPRRRRRRDAAQMDEDEEDNLDAFDPNFALNDLKGKSVAEWLVLDQPARHTAHRFRKFLLEFTDKNGVAVYTEKIQRMCENNGCSLELDFDQFYSVEAVIALWAAEAPAVTLKIFNEVATALVKEQFEQYDRISPEIYIRIANCPTAEALRDLRHMHVNRLIRVAGVVTRRSNVLPQIKYVTFSCTRCSVSVGPFYQGIEPVRVNRCPSCQSAGPFEVRSEQSSYRDFQKITLQESPGSVPPGRLPRHKEVILLADLVDYVRPGEEIEVTGIYTNILDAQLNSTNGFPLFSTVIEANHINKTEDAFASYKLNQVDRAAIMELGRDPRIGRRIIKSIAPSIYGHQSIKTAIALSMFGGVQKDIQGKHRLRGDINILMMGDPGTAKSQFLKYVEKTANRAVFTTGQGASAVGLTASVIKSPITREWTLEGGALVLADKGVCLIDEFDKMNDQDRTSIHEAMEQQSISVSKAGIVCTLQARCAVIAAANPRTGRYNPAHSFQDNVELTEPILSRFDVLCVVKDTVDADIDSKLAEFVVTSHMRSHPDYKRANGGVVQETDPDIIDQVLLRKYIMYARDNVKPKLNHLDQDKLAKVYSALRKESIACGSIPMTVRHVESMIRMAEARAKMHLREYVRQDDLDVAIQVMLESFLSANKLSVVKSLRGKFQKYMVNFRDHEELLHHLLKTMTTEKLRYQAITQKRRPSDDIEMISDKIDLDMDEFEVKAADLNIHDVKPFFESKTFKDNNYKLEERTDNRGRVCQVIVKTI